MDRISRIKTRLFEQDFFEKKPWWGDDETILEQEGVREKPLVIRKALAVRYVADHMPIRLKADELVVGIPTMSSVGFGKCFPKYTLPEEDAEAGMRGFTVKSVFGHHLINYETLLHRGVKGVRADILLQLKSCAAEAEIDTAEQRRREELYRAMLISIDALVALAGRYRDLLLEAAGEETEAVRRKEFFEMAAVCSRVPENPAESFHEALQCVLLAHTLLHSTMEMMPLGRADVYLYPYYQSDIKSGRITQEWAGELVGSWLAKFSDRINLAPELWEMHQTDSDTQFNGISADYHNALDSYDQGESFNFGTSGNHFFINMILGGQHSDGSDATTELTYLILEKWAFLELVSPVMSVRFHTGSPDELYRLCADILRRGSGEPAIYNDEVIIQGLTGLGIPLEDARCYSNDGCWEAIIPGKTDFGFCMPQLLQLLEYQLQGGRSLIRGRQEWQNVTPLSDYKTWEDFYAGFLALLAENVCKEIAMRVEHHPFRADIAPSTLASAFMDDCVGRGLEYSKGGALYHIFGTFLCGFGNCVDSLAAIKKAVYEKNWLSLTELAEMLRDNYTDNEVLRQRLIHSVPKFGNDDAFADDIAVQLLNDFEEIVTILQGKYHGKVMLGRGIATFEFFAKWGFDVGASADGRLSQAPVASNISPNLDVCHIGPTAAIRSVTKPDLRGYGLGGPLDIKMNPGEVAGAAGLLRLVGLIRSFLDLGGLILTITGVSDEDLRDAQIHPMDHKNLRVRLGGLSAYFIALSKEVQDSIITRASHKV